jgi:hypothetical protein
VNATTDTAAPLLGRCKECDYTIFAAREDVKVANAASDVRKGTGVWRWNNGFLARCDKGHKWFPCKAIKGTYSEKHECDSRCLNAKGWSCTCSCGGVNHGRGHAVTVTNAAELPTTKLGLKDPEPSGFPAPRTDGKHLGEVGKTIKGEVTVGPVRHLDSSTLYTFFTVNGGHVIKWFAPSHADPQWTEGQTLTIRAKVKSHDEFRGVPETRVTYVEEVE